jgi:sec-independent protein translocase protein TatA
MTLVRFLLIKESTVLKNFNGWEIIIVLVIVLLLFGARKLPDLARSIGASAKEFRKGLDEGMNDDDDEK